MAANALDEVQRMRERNVEFWDQAAPGWVRHAERHDALGAPLGNAALHALAAQPGERIVDVGCGCGGTTAAIAAVVGPNGSAIGVDLSSAMIGEARRRFPAGSGASFEVCDIDGVPAIPGAPFDAAYSRMTVMLFADPTAGLHTVRASLRPGGRLAATVFRGPDANPWLAAVVLGAAAHVGSLPPLPLGDEPGPFAFQDRNWARACLVAAGFGDVAVDPVDVTLEAPDDPDLVAEWLIEIGPAGAPYRAARPEAQRAARGGAIQLLRKFHTPGVGYRLPAGIWLLTAAVAG